MKNRLGGEPMSLERLLSAIWMGLVKLKVPNARRRKIMEQIENILDAEGYRKEKDDDDIYED